MYCTSVRECPCHSAAQDSMETTAGKWGCKQEMQELGINVRWKSTSVKIIMLFNAQYAGAI
jgi:hypothetical protein